MFVSINDSVEVIAEIGWNFMGDLNLAKQMVESAAAAGADTVKFQIWQVANLKPGPWDSDGRRQIYQKSELSDNAIEDLMAMADSAGVGSLFSVFCLADLERLSSICRSRVKIPSHEFYNRELLARALTAFDSVLISTGAVTEIELNESMLEIGTSPKVTLMHCVSCYPCASDRANLGRMDDLKRFNLPIGYSDHTESWYVPALAVAKGASVIEKHFTSNKNLPGRDNKFALEAPAFAEMVKFIREAERASRFLGVDALEEERDTMLNYRGRWGA